MKIIDLVQGTGVILPGVPFETVFPAAVTALREFCDRSKWYQVKITPVLIVDQAEYNLVMPTGVELVSVLSVEQDEIKLKVVAKPLKVRDSSDIQLEYYQSPVVDLGVSPPPNADSTEITATVAVRPTQTSATVDDRLLDWSRVITYGTLAQLFAQPISAWYNPQQADYYQIKFNDGVRKAGNQAEQNFVDNYSLGMATLV